MSQTRLAYPPSTTQRGAATAAATRARNTGTSASRQPRSQCSASSSMCSPPMIAAIRRAIVVFPDPAVPTMTMRWIGVVARSG